MSDIFELGTTFKDQADYAIFWITAISFFFLALIGGLLVYFSIRYSRRNNPVATQVDGHLGLEVMWTIIPTIIVAWFFWFGWEGYKTNRTVPENAMIIEVEAYKWGWNFKYPNGKVADHAYVPNGTPIKFVITTKDVVHSFYLPEFRNKRDAMPGYESFVWITPTELGEFNIYCTEYCGLNHWNMNRKLYVITPEEYNTWVNTVSADLDGETLYSQKCASCHSIDGSSMLGPTFKGLSGSVHKSLITKEGKVLDVTVDRDYLKESIIEPGAAIYEGYPNVMPSFTNLSNKEMENIIDFIESKK